MPGDVLIIRREQMRALSQITREALVERLAAHLRKHFPDACAALGPEGLVALISEGLARAEKHGFHSNTDVARWLNLMVTFGRAFDEDPRLPWAAARLASDAPSMNALYAEALTHIDEAQGLQRGS
jgi:hypothetical protein